MYKHTCLSKYWTYWARKLPTHLIHRKEGQICSDRNIYSERKRKKTNLTYILINLQIYNRSHCSIWWAAFLCLTSPTPCWNTWALYDRFRRWCLWEVIKSWGWSLTRIRALIKEIPQSSLFSTMQRYNENLGIQKGALTQPRTVRNRLLFIWYPVGWYFVKAALQTKAWSLLIFSSFP